MKRLLWVVVSLLSLVFFSQAKTALCQDQITAGQGETIWNLQIGLKNIGWVSYEAYAEAGGDAGSWVSPSTIWFGVIQPGETKTATYTLIIPKGAPLGTYYVYWSFYARSGSYTQYLSRYTVAVTVVLSSRSPAKLLPLWLLVGIVTLSPLWYWTRRKSVSERIIGRRLRRLIMSLAIVGTLFSGIFYVSWRIPLIPIVITDSKVETSVIIRSNVLTMSTHTVQTLMTTEASSTTRTVKGEDEIIVVSITRRSIVTSSYQIETTAWSTQSVAITSSFETTKHQTLSQMYPMLSLMLAMALAGISAFILVRIEKDHS